MKNTKLLKLYILLEIILFVSVITGCGVRTVPGDISWIPSPEKNSSSENGTKHEGTHTEEKDAKSYEVYTYSQIADALIDKSSNDVASMVWNNQCMSGITKMTDEELAHNMITYYFSTSEGDDANSGLSPEMPKKNLSSLSTFSGINILLKCGDTFSMNQGITLKSNAVLGCYGQGDRPVLDYRQELVVSWEKVKGYNNLWKADFKDIAGLYVADGTDSNGNIGQLWIDDECSFNRIYKTDEDLNLFSDMDTYGEGYFYIDSQRNNIYLTCETDPNEAKLHYSLPASAISIVGSNVKVRGVEIVGAGCHGISTYNIDNVDISCCFIHHVGGALLVKQKIRYGNAIELWGSGKELNVKGNVIEWIYDSAMTNQTSEQGSSQENIIFSNNLCRFSFWGIESWGDWCSVEGFHNLVYRDNAIMYICDSTNSEICVYSAADGRSLDANGKEYEETVPYITCRGDNWPFNRMAAINVAVAMQATTLEISGNICWETKRCMTLLSLPDGSDKPPFMTNNTFFATIPNKEVCLYRYTDSNGTIHYNHFLKADGNSFEISIGETDEKAYQRSYEELVRIVEAACQ